MSKQEHKLDTEAQIKATAMELFFTKGHFKATTQEIADAAGVNRTAINYYFRSRDNLFDLVLQEALQQIDANQRFIVESNLPFREKIEKFLDNELASAIKYPFLEIYVVTRISEKNAVIKKDPQFIKAVNKALDKELKAQIQKGAIKPISTTQFIINIASLVSFPNCIRPLLIENLNLSSEEFDKIIKERKQVILDTLFI